MRYTWTSIAIIIIWFSAILLLGSDRLSSPDIFFTYVMVITVVLSYIGFRSA